MSYVDPKLRPYFESLSIDLKNEILEQDREGRINAHKSSGFYVYFSYKGAGTL